MVDGDQDRRERAIHAALAHPDITRILLGDDLSDRSRVVLDGREIVVYHGSDRSCFGCLFQVYACPCGPCTIRPSAAGYFLMEMASREDIMRATSGRGRALEHVRATSVTLIGATR